MPPHHWPAEVDLFTEPHTRMKKLVHKYSKMVSKTDFSDELHMQNLLQNLINVFHEFKTHEDIENKHIMHELKSKLKAASVTSAAVCNCHSDNRLTHMLEMVNHGLRNWTEKTEMEKQTYGSNLQTALEDFTCKFIPHMEEEEEVFQPMLMKYFSYEELIQLKAKVIYEHFVTAKPEKFVEDLHPKDVHEVVQKDVEERALREVEETEQKEFEERELIEVEETGQQEVEERELREVEETEQKEVQQMEQRPFSEDICLKIFVFLNPQDLCRIALTCRQFNRISKDKSLWRGIYPVHWAMGNWTFFPETLGGVDGAGEFNDELMAEYTPAVYHDEDADVDESSYYNDEDKDYDDTQGSDKVMREVKIVSALVKHLLPFAGNGVKVVDLAYCKGLSSSLVHKILKLCPNVEVLDLTHTQVGDSAFDEYGISNRQARLRHLFLTSCPNITDQALFNLTGMSAYSSEVADPFNCELCFESDMMTFDTVCCRQRSRNLTYNSPVDSIQTSSLPCQRMEAFSCDSLVSETMNWNHSCNGNQTDNTSFHNVNRCACLSRFNEDNIDCGSCSLARSSLCHRNEVYSMESDYPTLPICANATTVYQSLQPNQQASTSDLRSHGENSCDLSPETEMSSLQNSFKETNCNFNHVVDNDEVQVQDMSFNDDDVDSSSHTCPLSHLQVLSLNGCNMISDHGIRALASGGGMLSLSRLDLSGCFRLTGDSIKHLISTCSPNIDQDTLFYCSNIPRDPFPSTASGCRNQGCGTRFCCSYD